MQDHFQNSNRHRPGPSFIQLAALRFVWLLVLLAFISTASKPRISCASLPLLAPAAAARRVFKQMRSSSSLKSSRPNIARVAIEWQSSRRQPVLLLGLLTYATACRSATAPQLRKTAGVAAITTELVPLSVFEFPFLFCQPADRTRDVVIGIYMMCDGDGNWVIVLLKWRLCGANSDLYFE